MVAIQEAGMKKLLKYILAGVVILVCLIGVFHFADAKTFKGRVIDADTKEPIEGAVVVAYWYKARDTIAGESTTLKDVKECLTDKNGEWSISGPKGRPHNPNPLFSLFTSTYYTREPQFIVFKPGYCSLPKGFSIDACRNRIKMIGDKDEGIGEGGTLELPKLTKREDRLRDIPTPDYGDSETDWNKSVGLLKKQKEFLRLLNQEDKNLGLSENKMYKEILNEK
jgi:hypothetical protein